MLSLKELEARWRATHDEGEPIGSKTAYRYDIEKNCADELAALREALRAEVETWPHFTSDGTNNADKEAHEVTHPLHCYTCRILRFIEGEVK